MRELRAVVLGHHEQHPSEMRTPTPRVERTGSLRDTILMPPALSVTELSLLVCDQAQTTHDQQGDTASALSMPGPLVITL